MWEYGERLPQLAPASVVSLGEGGTPLLQLPNLAATLGIRSLAAKAEHMNPTGSFKDRIASVAMSLVVERGLDGCLGTSSGNGAAAIAAYAARAGRRAVLFIVPTTPSEKLDQTRALGASVYRVRSMGVLPESSELVTSSVPALAEAHAYLPFITAFHYMPEAMQGTKTVAYELAEDAPHTTAVYVPVGGGGLLTGIHRGFCEVASAMPSKTNVPRLVGVQPSGCATLERALRDEDPRLDRPVGTTISGLQVATLYDAAGAKAAVRDSGGHNVVATDEEIWNAQHLLAKCGLLVEPAGAAALAGVAADARAGRLSKKDNVVIVLSGAGWKDSTALARLRPGSEVATIDPDEIPDVLVRDAAIRVSA